MPPYEDELGAPSYEVCPSCGFEFGNDDNPGTAAQMTFDGYRAAWIADGAPRFHKEWTPALRVSESCLWLGVRGDRWVVGRLQGNVADVALDARALLPLLGRDWLVACEEIAAVQRENRPLGPIPLAPTVSLALSGQMSALWASRAIEWLAAGFPHDDALELLTAAAQDMRLSQRDRHSAARVLKQRRNQP